MADKKTTAKKPAKPKAAAQAKPTRPAKPRPTQDQAGRPSPPDRDGNGAPGGSLPGNQTTEGAKGTDEAVLARREIAEDGLATVILKGVNIGRKTHHPIGVNGRIRNLKVGVRVQVNAAELEALVASHVEFETVSEGAVAAAVEGSSAAAETPAEETAEGATEGGEQDPPVGSQGDGNPNPEVTEPATGEVADGAATQTQEGTGGDTGNGGTEGAQA